MLHFINSKLCFRFFLVKYSYWGLFNEKGMIYPLFERLYFTAVAIFLLFVVMNVFANIAQTNHISSANAKDSNLYIDSCLNQFSAGNFTFNKNAFIVKSFEGLFLVFTSIMYGSILYKMRGKKIFNSKFTHFKKNILTLKETLILEIANGLFGWVFVISVDHLNYFVLYCKLYSTYCIILYFLIPILLLISLRKTLPELYVNPLNSPKTTEVRFYAIGNPINLEPRYDDFTISIRLKKSKCSCFEVKSPSNKDENKSILHVQTLDGTDAEKKMTGNLRNNSINVNISSVPQKCCQLPQIEV